MDLEAFEKQLAEKVEPIYTLVGDQPFLMDAIVDSLRTTVVSGPFADMNFNLFHADERGAAEKALETIEQLPMMAKVRLVVVREAEKISGKALDKLADYLNNPNDSTCLVLCFAKLAKNTKAWKRSNKYGQAIAFQKIYERQMPYWVNRMAKAQGKTISKNASAFLIRSIGANLAKANGEIEKAALYAGDSKTIEEDHVEAILASVKAESIFEMADSIGKKDKAAALYLLKKLLDGGEQPLRILWQVANHMKRLMLVRSLLAVGAPALQIGKALGVMDFVRDKLVAQASVFKRKELRTSIILLTKTDLELKSGRINPRAVLEKLFLDLCAKPKSRKRR